MTTVDPTLREAIDAVLDERLGALHTSFPARVLAYDVSAQTVDVQPALRREQPTGGAGDAYSFEALPVLYSVPVMWQRSGGLAATFPIAVGDWVLVHCAEQATAPWRLRAQAPSPPGLNDPHGLNGCVAIPGWYPDAKKLSNVSTADYELRTEGGQVLVRAKPNGSVELGGGASAVALDPLVRAAIAGAIAGHTHVYAGMPSGSGTTASGVLAGSVSNTGSSKVKAAP